VLHISIFGGLEFWGDRTASVN